MAIQQTKSVPVNLGVGAGASIKTHLYFYKTLVVSGTFTATLQIQGSVDDTNWVTIGSNITTASVVRIEEQVPFLRINTSAYTSGTPVATLVSMNHRTDV